jgi:anaerobic ribonucleoside-triphosphate reductase
MKHKHDYCDDCGELHSNDRYDLCPKCEEEDQKNHVWSFKMLKYLHIAQDCWSHEQYDHWRFTTLNKSKHPLEGLNDDDEV